LSSEVKKSKYRTSNMATIQREFGVTKDEKYFIYILLMHDEK
jgi:hypothetical protein